MAAELRRRSCSPGARVLLGRPRPQGRAGLRPGRAAPHGRRDQPDGAGRLRAALPGRLRDHRTRDRRWLRARRVRRPPGRLHRGPLRADRDQGRRALSAGSDRRRARGADVRGGAAYSSWATAWSTPANACGWERSTKPSPRTRCSIAPSRWPRSWPRCRPTSTRALRPSCGRAAREPARGGRGRPVARQLGLERVHGPQVRVRMAASRISWQARLGSIARSCSASSGRRTGSPGRAGSRRLAGSPAARACSIPSATSRSPRLRASSMIPRTSAGSWSSSVSSRTNGRAILRMSIGSSRRWPSDE